MRRTCSATTYGLDRRCAVGLSCNSYLQGRGGRTREGVGRQQIIVTPLLPSYCNDYEWCHAPPISIQKAETDMMPPAFPADVSLRVKAATPSLRMTASFLPCIRSWHPYGGSNNGQSPH